VAADHRQSIDASSLCEDKRVGADIKCLRATFECGKAMFQMMGVFAEFERAMIQEPIAPALEKRIREALATPGRPGVRVIAKQFGIDPGTVQRMASRLTSAGRSALG
jgi:DNA invertase Pin-like site-specific DNA recombinase